MINGKLHSLIEVKSFSRTTFTASLIFTAAFSPFNSIVLFYIYLKN